MKLQWFPLFAVCWLLNCDGSSSHRELKTKFVVILVIDGARYSETWGDSTRTFIPYLSSELAPQGVLLDQFFNDGFTHTTSGHTAITTGHYQTIANDGTELPDQPSLFQRLISEKGLDTTMAWVVVSKTKLEVLTDCKDSVWSGAFRPSFDGGVGGARSTTRDDSATLTAAMQHLTAFHPFASLIHFKEPDVTAHGGDWSGYLSQIRRTDSLSLLLWNFLQDDPEFSDRTALFVTNDHGRHLDSIAGGFASHGDDCAGCRRISLLAAGPDFKKNKISSIVRDQTDITATAAFLLGVTWPDSNGQVMNELFVHSPN